VAKMDEGLRRILVWAIGGVGVIAGGGGAGQTGEPILPLPEQVRLDAKKVALGDKLFHDRRFSKDNSLACANCHNLATGGVDRRVSSVGINGAKGSINAPTVFNSGFNFRQFWDGRADSLEEQINFPVHDPSELGSNWQEVINKLAQDAALSKQFQELYADGVQVKNVRDAIATFERSLVTPNSKFDRYLRGDKAALDGEEAKGYQLFKSYGCIACHQGINVGGNMFQKFGVMDDYFAKRGRHLAADLGRYNITKVEDDKHVFKVPSLRNVAATAPYFHDGSASTLDEAVEVMFRYQLGRSAPPADKRLIVKFLHTLTGEYKGKLLAQQP
jgi:cytochrome c peroxidase